MKHKIYHPNPYQEIIVESFSGYSDFFRVCDSRTNINFPKENYREITPDKSKTTVRSYEEAKNKLLFGDNENIPRLKQELHKVQKTKTRTAYSLKEDIQGFIPVVPSAMLGLPNSMLNIQPHPVPSRVLSFYFDSAIPWNTDTGDYNRQGIRLLNLLLSLEKQGYRIRLSMMTWFCDSLDTNFGQQVCYILPLKSENQPLNLRRIAFPFLDAGANRFLGFDWISRLPELHEECFSGLGYAFCSRDNRDNQEILKQILSKTDYYINYKTDITRIEDNITNPGEIKHAG